MKYNEMISGYSSHKVNIILPLKFIPWKSNMYIPYSRHYLFDVLLTNNYGYNH